MANNTKFLTWGVGWLKNNAKGSQYVSGKAGDTKTGVTLILRNAKGEEMEVTSFAMFFNENKAKPTQPDVRFVLTTE